MPVCLILVAILSGVLAAGAAAVAGWSLVAVVLVYPLAGSLAALAMAAALCLCARRRGADTTARDALRA